MVFIQGVALERTWPLWTTSTLVPWPPWLLWFFHGFSYRIVTWRRRRQDLCAERGTSGATYGPECSRSGFNDEWLGWVLIGTGRSHIVHRTLSPNFRLTGSVPHLQCPHLSINWKLFLSCFEKKIWTSMNSKAIIGFEGDEFYSRNAVELGLAGKTFQVR